MARTIRFHLDEHCDPAIAAGLRLHRVDVTTTPDAGLLSARDEEHIAYALRTSRVIYTRDEDFLRLSATGVEHRGVAFSAQQIIELVQGFAALLLTLHFPVELRRCVQDQGRRRFGSLGIRAGARRLRHDLLQ